MKESAVIKGLGGGAVAFVSFLFGTFDVAFQTLLMFIILDYGTGILKAFKSKSIDKDVGFWGIAKKVGLLSIVAVAWRLDVLTGANGSIRLMALYAYIGNELFSITQNLIGIGVPIPEAVAKYFKNFEEKSTSGVSLNEK